MKKRFYCIALVFALSAVFLAGCNTADGSGTGSSDSSSRDALSESVSQNAMSELLGEGYYLFDEYDIDMSFESICEQLKAMGYQVTPSPSHSEEDIPEEILYVATKSGSLDENLTQSIFITKCESAELAKEVYTCALNYSFSAYEHYVLVPPFERGSSIIRINDCVYSTMGRSVATIDLLTVAGIPLPAPTPLYTGGVAETLQGMDYETVYTRAEALGYTFYQALDYQEVFRNCNGLVPPERDAYLFLVRMKDLESQIPNDLSLPAGETKWTYEQLATYYLKLFAGTETLEHQSFKLVMISEDAFVIGTVYHVDEFLERVQKAE